jgi:hypothetical protein
LAARQGEITQKTGRLTSPRGYSLVGPNPSAVTVLSCAA